MTLSETARFWAENPDIAVEAFLVLVFPFLLLLAMTISLGRYDGKRLKDIEEQRRKLDEKLNEIGNRYRSKFE